MAYILLFLFWLVLNGKVTLEIILVGAALCGCFAFVGHRFLDTSHHLGQRILTHLFGLIRYAFYLVGQIILSNLQVIRLILHPTPGRPKLVWFQPKFRNSAAMLGLANSITLTPGTVTVGMGDDTLCVYALRPEFADGIEECGFVTRLHQLEEGKHG